ncbi:3'-5' exoribonuclease 1-like [Oscarella lobularis]|uniref:3'-5' exoribonuclease 1-like n=1 Tax=Oscarella lobularis TaxID=121494 RepID=UPI003313E47D
MTNRFPSWLRDVLGRMAASKSWQEVLRTPKFHKQSLINGVINDMTKDELKDQLKSLEKDERCDKKGNKEILQKRLKLHYRHLKSTPSRRSASAIVSNEQQPFDYLCVLDFEATCDDAHDFEKYPHEIIEFPVVLINTSTMETDGEFHRYCRPTLNPILTEYCTSLTGITQAQVDSSNEFPIVFREFETWLHGNGLGTESSFSFATHGSADIDKFLRHQCAINEIRFPDYAKRWADVRRHYANFYGVSARKCSVTGMLDGLEWKFEGREHSGIDDARNIAKIVVQLMKDGRTMTANDQLN